VNQTVRRGRHSDRLILLLIATSIGAICLPRPAAAYQQQIEAAAAKWARP
jgi:hypothetical protein